MKALCKEDIEISRQKIVDILERLIFLVFIVLVQKEDKNIVKGKMFSFPGLRTH